MVHTCWYHPIFLLMMLIGTANLLLWKQFRTPPKKLDCFIVPYVPKGFLQEHIEIIANHGHQQTNQTLFSWTRPAAEQRYWDPQCCCGQRFAHLSFPSSAVLVAAAAAVVAAVLAAVAGHTAAACIAAAAASLSCLFLYHRPFLCLTHTVPKLPKQLTFLNPFKPKRRIFFWQSRAFNFHKQSWQSSIHFCPSFLIQTWIPSPHLLINNHLQYQPSILLHRNSFAPWMLDWIPSSKIHKMGEHVQA